MQQSYDKGYNLKYGCNCFSAVYFPGIPPREEGLLNTLIPNNLLQYPMSQNPEIGLLIATNTVTDLASDYAPY